MTHLGLGFSSELPLGRSPGGISTIGLPASLESLRKSSTSSLGVSAACLGRSTGCLRSAIFSVTTCLGGRSADFLGISTYYLRANYFGGRGTGYLSSSIFLGTNYLGRADCLRTNSLGERGTRSLSSTVFPRTNPGRQGH